jgi:hypothetical protein
MLTLNVYAFPLVLTPDTVTQGVDVVATASGATPTSLIGPYQIDVYADNTGVCGGGVSISLPATIDDSGNLIPVIIPTSGLSVGTHCVSLFTDSAPPWSSLLTVNPGAGTDHPPAWYNRGCKPWRNPSMECNP